jgi:glutathione S-transferase
MARGHFYQWMAHLTNSVQPAMLRYYYPERHTTDAGGHAAVTAKATEEIATLWGRIDRHLAANGPYLLGERFSAADIFAYMLSTWQQCCPDTYQRFPNIKRLADKVAARPAMERVIRKNAA